MGLQACTSRGGELAPDCLFRWWEYGRFLYCFLLYVSLVAKSCLTLLRPHRLQPTRLLCPSVFPGKNTGVDCHPLLQGNLLNPGIEPASPALQVDSLLLRHQRNPRVIYREIQKRQADSVTGDTMPTGTSFQRLLFN